MFSLAQNFFCRLCLLIFIDKTDSSDPTRREFFWMTVPKTKAPFGLDIDNVTIINFYPQLISISACDLL